MKKGIEIMHEECFDVEPLRVAILRRAVCDYKSAIKRRDFNAMTKLEKFFLGEWGQLLSRDNGQYIIDECNRIVNN